MTELPEPDENARLMARLRDDGGVDLRWAGSTFLRRGDALLDSLDMVEQTSVLKREIGAAGSVFPDWGFTGAELDISRPNDDMLRTYMHRGMRTSGQPDDHYYAIYLPLTALLAPVHASRLCGEIVVFELGDSIERSYGIYVLSLDSMRIARLVEDGMGPCVVYDHPPPGWDADVLLERLNTPR